MVIADAFILGGFSSFGRTAAFRTARPKSVLEITFEQNGACGVSDESSNIRSKVTSQLTSALNGKTVDLAATCDCSYAAAGDPTAHY